MQVFNAARYNRQKKTIARDRLFKTCEPRESILTLPGDSALCSQSMLHHGIITEDTPQQWVENKKIVFRTLPHISHSLNLKNVSIHYGSLEDYVPTKKVDLLNADLESSFTEKFGIALENTICNFFLPNATMILWVKETARNQITSDFHDWFAQEIKRDSVLLQTADKVINEITDLSHAVRAIVLLKCALRRFSYEFIQAEQYADTRCSMFAIRFDNLNLDSYNSGLPSFGDLVTRFRMQNHREYLPRNQMSLFDKLTEYFKPHGRSIIFNKNQYELVDSTGKTIVSKSTIEELYEIFSYAV